MSQSTLGAYGSTRTDVLFMCLTAIQDFTSVYFAVAPQKSWYTFSMINMGHIYFAMTALSKLSLFEAEDWDVRSVRAILDLSRTLDRVIEMLEEASRDHDGVDGNGLWHSITRRMEHVKVWYDGLVANKNQQSLSQEQTQPQNGIATAAFDINQFDLLDEAFWAALPGNTDYLQQ